MDRVSVEISYKNLQHNLDLIKRITNNKSIICMVKDNAYGLGGVNISKYLSREPLVKAFAVASFGEAMHLKEKGIKLFEGLFPLIHKLIIGCLIYKKYLYNCPKVLLS